MAEAVPGGSADLAAGPVVLANGIEGESIRIPTANPTGFHQAISDPDGMPATEILGMLFPPFGPERSEGPWPVAIIVPGSLGVAPSHVAKADYLTDAGIACCVIDPFGTRGVISTVANQAQYTFAASAWDVLATAKVLAAREDLDATRIGAQGHSRGGAAVLSAACMAPLLGPGRALSLRAVYAAYPWSGMQFERPDVGDTIVRSVIGERDEWCLPQQVQAHMHAMRLIGCDASFRLFAEAQHSFDRDTAVELIPDASIAPGAPTTYIREDGALVHPLTGEANPGLSELDVMRYSVKSGHGRRGARIGTAGNQARAFHEDMMGFWRTTLLGRPVSA